MEGLMNKIVVNPAFINDDKLNAKIEKIFGVEAFQKMVDNAEVFQDISNTSIFNQTEFLQRSMNIEAQSFQKLLPTHSQMREDEDPEALPCFGQTENDINENLLNARPEPDELDKEVNQLLSGNPAIAQLLKSKPAQIKDFDDELKNAVEQPSFQRPEDSFSTLPMADNLKANGGDMGKTGQDPALKMSMIQPDEEGTSFF